MSTLYSRYIGLIVVKIKLNPFKLSSLFVMNQAKFKILIFFYYLKKSALLIWGWNWTGLCSVSYGSIEDGAACTMVLLLLLHVDQPRPLLHLWRGPDVPRLCSRRETRVDRVGQLIIYLLIIYSADGIIWNKCRICNF